MKRNVITKAVTLLVCLTLILPASRIAAAGSHLKTSTHVAAQQNTERPLDVTISHVHEGKHTRISSIHSTQAGNRLTFIYHDGSRIELKFSKPIRVGNYEIHDRTSELQATYYPAGGYPVMMQGYVTMYSIKPLTGRVVQLSDSEHTLHISSPNIFSF